MSKYYRVPVNKIRTGSVMLDQAAGKHVKVQSAPILMPYTDMRNPKYVWKADGHDYTSQLYDKRGNLLHVKILKDD